MVLFILHSPAFAIRHTVIKNPKANMAKKNYIPLERVKTIGEELGGGQYLFHATGGVENANNRLLVMDVLQSKIFILQKDYSLLRTFGGQGEGPGEFLRANRYSPVYLSIGLDGNLWVNEFNKLRVSVFDPEGKFLRFVRLKQSPGNLPQADSRGRLLLQRFQERNLIFFYNDGEVLFNLPRRKQEKEFLFLEPEMDPQTREIIKKEPFSYTSMELQYLLIDDHTLAILFNDSGEYYLIRNKNIIRHTYLWPRDLIADRLALSSGEFRGKGNVMFFIAMNSYCGKRDRLFIEADSSGTHKRRLIYEMTPNGDITAVYFIDSSKYRVSSILLAAGRDSFYFHSEAGVDIFKPIKRG